MPEKRKIVEQTAQDFEKLPNDMKSKTTAPSWPCCITSACLIF